MREIANIGGINILLNINQCAHNCLYCRLDNHRAARFPISRYLAVVERFLDWKQSRHLKEIDIRCLLFYCDDYDLATAKKLLELQRRVNNHIQLFLGGLRMRSESEMRVWLSERQALGIRKVVATFLGCGAVHDYWNNREGDFDFLISTLKTAAGLGMKMVQRILLLKSTLTCIEELLNKLDELPGKVRKQVLAPLQYSGRAVKLEAERVTEADLEGLPEQAKKFLPDLRSERQWIEFMRQYGDPPVKDLMFRFVVDDANIDSIEAMSCDEIFADQERRVRAAYAMMPSRQELIEACGNPDSGLLYQFAFEPERKWLNRYLETHPINFERAVTRWSIRDD